MGYFFAFGQAFTWACTSLILRSLSTKLDPFLVNGLRAAFGLLFIIPMVAIMGAWGDYQLITWPRLGALAGSVVIGGVFGDALYVHSLKLLGVGRAFPITNTFPLFTVFFSFLLLGSELNWMMLAGAILTLLGVYFISRPKEHLENLGTALPTGQLLKGTLVALGAAVAWGLTTVILSFGLRGSINPAVANSVRVPFVVLFSSLGTLRNRGARQSWKNLNRRTLLLLFLGGILGWGISGSQYLTAVQLIGPSKTAIISTTSPLFGVALSIPIFRERPTKYVWLGTILTIIGIVLVI